MLNNFLWFVILVSFIPLSGQMIVNATNIEIKKVQSHDGVGIVYLTAGTGNLTLIFLHGGYADKSYWHNQVRDFSGNYKVIALDLARYGESGKNY